MTSGYTFFPKVHFLERLWELYPRIQVLPPRKQLLAWAVSGLESTGCDCGFLFDTWASCGGPHNGYSGPDISPPLGPVLLRGTRNSNITEKQDPKDNAVLAAADPAP